MMSEFIATDRVISGFIEQIEAALGFEAVKKLFALLDESDEEMYDALADRIQGFEPAYFGNVPAHLACTTCGCVKSGLLSLYGKQGDVVSCEMCGTIYTIGPNPARESRNEMAVIVIATWGKGYEISGCSGCKNNGCIDSCPIVAVCSKFHYEGSWLSCLKQLSSR